MEEIMLAPDYATFLDRLIPAHRAVHNGVGGDFQTNTAPYGGFLSSLPNSLYHGIIIYLIYGRSSILLAPYPS
jgi:hypothetical protein